MINNYIAGLCAFCFLFVGIAGCSTPVDEVMLLSDYVKPLAKDSGKTFPGATTPYGMVQVSPNTITGGDNSSGYSPGHKTIEGFAFTQMSGAEGPGNLGNFLVMPTTGKLTTTAGTEDGSIKGYRSRFNKKTEVAKAGYYAVELTDYRIKVEACAALHSGILRFTFPENEKSRIQIDLARRVGGTSIRQYVKVIDAHTIQGWMLCSSESGLGSGEGNPYYTVYFHTRFSKPLANYGFWSADISADGKSISQASIIRGQSEIEGRQIGFFTEFSTASKEEVTMKVGISFVDMDGAKKNFEEEVGGRDFPLVRKEALEAWARELERIKVTGGSREQKEVFYTNLYRTMMDPRISMDVDGCYVGGGGMVHTDPGFVKRTIFSGWNVFGNQLSLLAITDPKQVYDLFNSLMTLAIENGEEDLSFPRDIPGMVAFMNKRWVKSTARNKDVSPTSAEQVLSAVGLRRLHSEEKIQYEIVNPAFPTVELQLDSLLFGGKGVFAIIAHDHSPENPYIQRVVLNGKEYKKPYIEFEDIIAGGTLELYMSNNKVKKN